MVDAMKVEYWVCQICGSDHDHKEDAEECCKGG